MRLSYCAVLVATAAMFMTSCATAPKEASGYLGAEMYGRLADARSPSGEKVKRWVAPGAKLDSYEAVWIARPTFYPEPQGSDQVSAGTLDEVASYMNEALTREMTGVVTLADRPGPRVLALNTAITAAAPKDRALKPYQYIPVAFILSGGSGGKGASLALEYSAVDLTSDRVVGAGMRETTGPRLRSKDQVLALEDFRPLVDIWAKDVTEVFKAAAQAQ